MCAFGARRGGCCEFAFFLNTQILWNFSFLKVQSLFCSSHGKPCLGNNHGSFMFFGELIAHFFGRWTCFDVQSCLATAKTTQCICDWFRFYRRKVFEKLIFRPKISPQKPQKWPNLGSPTAIFERTVHQTFVDFDGFF